MPPAATNHDLQLAYKMGERYAHTKDAACLPEQLLLSTDDVKVWRSGYWDALKAETHPQKDDRYLSANTL